MNSMQHNRFTMSGSYPGYMPPPNGPPLSYYNGYPNDVGQGPSPYYAKPSTPNSAFPPGMARFASPVNNPMYYQQYGLNYQYGYNKYGASSNMNYSSDVRPPIHLTSAGGLQAPSTDLGLTGSMFSKNKSTAQLQMKTNNQEGNPAILSPVERNTSSPRSPLLNNNLKGAAVSTSPNENVDGQKDIEKMKRCQICGQVFQLMSECLAHMKNVHESPQNMYSFHHGLSSSSQPISTVLPSHSVSLPLPPVSKHPTMSNPNNPLTALERMGWGDKPNIASMHPSSPMTSYPSSILPPTQHRTSVPHHLNHNGPSAVYSPFNVTNPHVSHFQPPFSNSRFMSPIPQPSSSIVQASVNPYSNLNPNVPVSVNSHSNTHSELLPDSSKQILNKAQMLEVSNSPQTSRKAVSNNSTKIKKSTLHSVSSIMGENQVENCNNQSILSDVENLQETDESDTVNFDNCTAISKQISIPKSETVEDHVSDNETLAGKSSTVQLEVIEGPSTCLDNEDAKTFSVEENNSPKGENSEPDISDGSAAPSKQLTSNLSSINTDSDTVSDTHETSMPQNTSNNMDSSANIVENKVESSLDASETSISADDNDKTFEKTSQAKEMCDVKCPSLSPTNQSQIHTSQHSETSDSLISQNNLKPHCNSYSDQNAYPQPMNANVMTSDLGFKPQGYTMQNRFTSPHSISPHTGSFYQGQQHSRNVVPQNYYYASGSGAPQGNWVPTNSADKAMWSACQSSDNIHSQKYFSHPQNHGSQDIHNPQTTNVDMSPRHCSDTPPVLSPQSSNLKSVVHNEENSKEQIEMPTLTNCVSGSSESLIEQRCTSTPLTSPPKPQSVSSDISSSPALQINQANEETDTVKSDISTESNSKLERDFADETKEDTTNDGTDHEKTNVLSISQKMNPNNKFHPQEEDCKSSSNARDDESSSGYSKDDDLNQSEGTSDSEMSIDDGPKFTVLKPAKRKFGYIRKDGTFIGPKRIKIAKQIQERQELRLRNFEEKIRQNEIEQQMIAQRNSANDKNGPLSQVLLQSSILLVNSKVEAPDSVNECIALIQSEQNKLKLLNGANVDEKTNLAPLSEGSNKESSVGKGKLTKKNQTKVLRNEKSVQIQNLPTVIPFRKLRAKDFKWSQYIKSTRYWCPDCGQGFKYPKEASNHSEEKCKLNCLYMLECYIVVKDIQTHPVYGTKVQELLEEYQIEAEHQCSTCSEIILNKADFLVHTDTHKDFMPWKCTICGSSFKIRGSLKEHLRYTHMKGRVPCLKCNKVFPTSTLLRQHVKVHTQHYKYKSTKNRDEELRAAMQATAGALDGPGMPGVFDENEKLSQEANEYRTWCRMMEMNAMKNISTPGTVSGDGEDEDGRHGYPDKTENSYSVHGPPSERL